MNEKEMIEKVSAIHDKVEATDQKVTLIGKDVHIIKSQSYETNEGMKSALTKLADSIDVQTRVFNLATLSLQSMTDSKKSDASSTDHIVKYGVATIGLIIVAVCLIAGVLVVKDLNDMLNQVMKLKLGVS